MKPWTDTDVLKYSGQGFQDSRVQVIFNRLYCKTDIENAVTVRADKKPSGCIAVLSKDIVEPVFIPALRAILELVFHLD